MLLAIADNANEYGEAWPSVPTLAAKCRMSVRNAQELLSRLADAGELHISVQGGMRTPAGATNMYTIVTPSAELREGVKPTAPGEAHRTGAVGRTGAVQRSQGVQSTAPVGVKPTAPKPSVKPSANHQMLQQQPAAVSEQKETVRERMERMKIEVLGGGKHE